MTLPLLTVITLYTGEIYDLVTPYYEFKGERLLWFYIYLGLSGVMGIALTMFVTLAYQVCDPLTVNIVGIFKDVM